MSHAASCPEASASNRGSGVCTCGATAVLHPTPASCDHMRVRHLSKRHVYCVGCNATMHPHKGDWRADTNDIRTPAERGDDR